MQLMGPLRDGSHPSGFVIRIPRPKTQTAATAPIRAEAIPQAEAERREPTQHFDDLSDLDTPSGEEDDGEERNATQEADAVSSSAESDAGVTPSEHEGESEREGSESEQSDDPTADARRKKRPKYPESKTGQLKAWQTNPHTKLWSNEVFFPGQERLRVKDPMKESSVLVAMTYCCYNTFGCKVGDCAAQLSALTVDRIRKEYSNGSLTTPCSDTTKLDDMVQKSRDSSARGGFRPVLLKSPGGDVCYQVCIGAAALICGYTGRTFRQATQKAPRSDWQPAGASAGEQEREKEYISRVRSYIHDVVCNQHEQQPVTSLGNQSGKETVLNKESWVVKLQKCNEWFADPARGSAMHPLVCSVKMFKKLWNEEAGLKEKKASEASKCDTCANLAAAMNEVAGVNTAEGKQRRSDVRAGMDLHERNHLGERTEMDRACLRSLAHPRSIWTIMADAATQRNFELPRIFNKTSKQFRELPHFGLKLMATYSPGFGFLPFLVHDSMKSGANLLWTVVWYTIQAMRAHYGFLADELHLQLDNTTAENKNTIMLAIAGWLVGTGLFRRVRVFFLMVGHTHIIIDQIFGVITKYVKRSELFTVPDLENVINYAMSNNTQYQAQDVRVLTALFDFFSFGKEKVGLNPATYIGGHPTYWDEFGLWRGYRDFLFTVNAATENMAESVQLQYRQSSQAPYLDPVSPIKNIPAADVVPALAECRPIAKWGSYKGKSIIETVNKCLVHARVAIPYEKRNQIVHWWQRHLGSFPERIADLAPPVRFPPLHRSNQPTAALVVRTVPTNEGVAAPEENAEEEEEAIYRAGLPQDRMQNPLFDMMVSSDQTQQTLDKKIKAFRDLHRCCNGPTRSSASLVYPGDWLLVWHLEQVRLACVVKLIEDTEPASADVKFTGQLFSHTMPEGDNPPKGFWGTWQQTSITNTAKAKTASSLVYVACGRSTVLVYNLNLAGRGGTRRLRVQTLRVLAAAKPDLLELAVPAEVPASHKFDERADSDSGEEGGQGLDRNPGPAALLAAPGRQRPPAAKKGPQAPKKARPKPRRAQPSSGSDEDSSPDDEEDEGDEEDEEPHIEDEEDDVSDSDEDSRSGTGEASSGAEGPSERSSDDEDMLVRDLPEVQAAELRAFIRSNTGTDTLLFLNNKEDPLLASHVIPCGLAYVTDLVRTEDHSPGTHSVTKFHVAGTVQWYNLGSADLKRRTFSRTANTTYSKYEEAKADPHTLWPELEQLVLLGSPRETVTMSASTIMRESDEDLEAQLWGNLTLFADLVLAEASAFGGTPPPIAVKAQWLWNEGRPPRQNKKTKTTFEWKKNFDQDLSECIIPFAVSMGEPRVKYAFQPDYMLALADECKRFGCVQNE